MGKKKSKYNAVLIADKIVTETERDPNLPNKSNKFKAKHMKTVMPLRQKFTHFYTKLLSAETVSNLIFNPSYLPVAACAFLIFEAIMNVFIIENVKYTEIDWKAYMQEVEGFLNGTWDYSRLKGDTGPLVYPAGFVYVFSILYYITDKGRNLYLAQYIFAGIYLLTLSLIFRIYNKSKKLPPYILVFICCMSYRIHSIFVLRLFNDPVAMVFLYSAINFFINGWWTTGSVIFSLAVSVKMNVLLFAPALLMAFLHCLGLTGTIRQLSVCFFLQVVLALPFLLVNPTEYVLRSFNLGRVFLYEWTVNWRFLPEEVFVHKGFHMALLATHLLLLLVFAKSFWNRCLSNFSALQSSNLDVSCQLFLLPLFTSNLVGMALSRSLHYQFYVWYFHSLPYLLWSTRLSVASRLLLLGVVELCWNTFPSTWWSSALLHACHVIILVALFLNRPSVERVQAVRKRLTKMQ